MNQTTDIIIDERIFIFETVMRVRSTETDFGQYMSIQALSTNFIEAMKRFFYSRGIKDINTDYQGLVVNNMTISSISFVRAREELLYEVGVSDLAAETGNIVIKVSRMFDTSIVAKASMQFANYDYRLNQLIPLSQTIIDALDTQPFIEDPDGILP
ncbi:thioesterase [Psychrobacter sp. I-STPA10]|uniref:thioesterase n=1 Tax=Psychrobacter sp. I-STPA10 TaxID=2585769 RepID=UPI001E338F81|nr:thioesterase [Psychrobacter sp. I-STPA10]